MSEHSEDSVVSDLVSRDVTEEKESSIGAVYSSQKSENPFREFYNRPLVFVIWVSIELSRRHRCLLSIIRTNVKDR